MRYEELRSRVELLEKKVLPSKRIKQVALPVQVGEKDSIHKHVDELINKFKVSIHEGRPPKQDGLTHLIDSYTNEQMIKDKQFLPTKEELKRIRNNSYFAQRPKGKTRSQKRKAS